MGLLTRLYGSAVIAANAIGQPRVPYWPPERLREERERRVRRIVRHAADTVPYYRRLFGELGIDPAEIRTADDLERLPLLDHEVVRRDPAAFRSTSRWGDTAVPFRTTGTSGTALAVYHDRHSLLLNSAFNLRERAVVRNLLRGTSRPCLLYIGYVNATVDGVREFLQEARFAPRRATGFRLEVSDPLEKVLQEIKRIQPDVLASCGSYLENLFRTVWVRQIDMHRPKLVAYGGDAMTEGGRRFIEEEFGVPVYTSYQAVEAFKIGFFCEERTHFHLHEDLTHVRIVDSGGQTLPQGQVGEVVISNLVNRATVLLNYRLGDLAALADGLCPCGRTLPLLSDLQGRTEDVVYLPNGEWLHAWAVTRVMSVYKEVIRFQLIQHGLDDFEVRMTTADRATYERLRDAFVSSVRGVLGRTAVIRSEYQPELEPGPGGKFKRVVSYVKGPHASA